MLEQVTIKLFYCNNCSKIFEVNDENDAIAKSQENRSSVTKTVSQSEHVGSTGDSRKDIGRNR